MKTKKNDLNPIAALLGTTYFLSIATSPIVNATDNPFSFNELSDGGYMIAQEEGSCGEGSCGESDDDKDGEGSCGEGSCGESGEDEKGEEGSCGEGSCGEST